MTDKRETAGGQRYPSRISIPVPRNLQSRPTDPPAPYEGGQDGFAVADRTVEAPVIVDPSGITTLPVDPQAVEEVPAPKVPFVTKGRPATASLPVVAVQELAPSPRPPSVVSGDAWTATAALADLRSEVRFYRMLVVGLIAAVFVTAMLCVWLAARGRG